MQGVLKSIPVPPEILAVPGHYSVVGLLPDDHTFAKGSLFVLAPGTQGVVFDVDGECCLVAGLELIMAWCCQCLCLLCPLRRRPDIAPAPARVLLLAPIMSQPCLYSQCLIGTRCSAQL